MTGREYLVTQAVLIGDVDPSLLLPTDDMAKEIMLFLKENNV